MGYLGKDMMIGMGDRFWGNALFVLPQNLVLLESEYIPQAENMFPLLYTLIGALLGLHPSFRSPSTGVSTKDQLVGEKVVHNVKPALVF